MKTKPTKRIKDTMTVTGGLVYTNKQVRHLKGHVEENNWEELKSKLTNPETAKDIYAFTERNGNLVFYSMFEKHKV